MVKTQYIGMTNNSGGEIEEKNTSDKKMRACNLLTYAAAGVNIHNI